MEIITGAIVYTFYSKMILNPSALANVKGSVNFMDKMKMVISEYSPEKRAAIDRIQEKVTHRDICKRPNHPKKYCKLLLSHLFSQLYLWTAYVIDTNKT